MLTKICLATNNKDKLKEIKKILSPKTYKLLTLRDLGIKADIEETGATLRENALIKAKTAYDLTGLPSLSDDTGLFVKALSGQPGVLSARYSGKNATYESNVRKLLSAMKGKSDTNAYFSTVVCLYLRPGKYYFREGRVYGKILPELRGKGGFGYDPVFYHRHLRKTFAELTLDEKNAVSHRKRAFQAIKPTLDKYFN